MIVWWLVGMAVASGCEEPSTFLELSRTLLDGEQAIRESDQTSLEAAEVRAETLLLCLASPLRPADVASFMRLEGIARFVRKEREAAVAWFSAARTVDPSWSLPEALFSEGHPLRRAFEGAPKGDAETVRLPRPRDGRVSVNGRATDELPVALPWVLQWWDGAGNVRVTAFGEGEPAAWPYPLRDDEPRGWQAIVAGAFQAAPSRDQGDLRGGLVLTGVVGVGRRLGVDFGLRSLLTRVRVDDGTEGRVVPGLHAGVRGGFDVAGLPAFVGAALLATSHEDRAVAPGGLAKAGVQLGGRRRFAEVGLEAGFSREPFVLLAAGFGFGR